MKINFIKLPYENYQNTGEGLVARCDKQKWGYTKKVIHWCLGHYQDLNALGPAPLRHLNPGSVLNSSTYPVNNYM